MQARVLLKFELYHVSALQKEPFCDKKYLKIYLTTTLYITWKQGLAVYLVLWVGQPASWNYLR